MKRKGDVGMIRVTRSDMRRKKMSGKEGRMNGGMIAVLREVVVTK